MSLHDRSVAILGAGGFIGSHRAMRVLERRPSRRLEDIVDEIIADDIARYLPRAEFEGTS